MSFTKKFLYRKCLIITALIIFSIAVSVLVFTRHSITELNLISSANAEEAKEVKEKKILYWTCGMHPSVKMDKPGKCPICAMDLVPVYEKGADAKEEGAFATIELSERTCKRAQVKADTISFLF